MMAHSYLPHTDAERRRMLNLLGLASQEDLLSVIPPGIRNRILPDLPPAQTEIELVESFEQLAARNTDLLHHRSYLGAGIYHHHIPAVVNHMAGRSEFYTAYTPYQPEMSQGMLQAIFEFQTMIAELCGLPVANASLYDGATALAEAVKMTLSAERNKILISPAVHPEYREVLRTYNRFLPVVLEETPLRQGTLAASDLPLNQKTAALVVGYPNFFGLIENLPSLAAAAHQVGAALIVTAYPIALGLLESPGRLGADIVVGEGQSLGSPPNLGGPGLGFMACGDNFLRRIPGRLAGQTVDREGRRGFVLTLQTREQHIKRERAASNICSNAALCALRAAVYLSSLGPSGFSEVATQSSAAAHYALDRLTSGGKFSPLFPGAFFNEFTLRTPVSPTAINKTLAQEGIIGGLDLGRFYPELGPALMLAFTELHTAADIDRLTRIMEAMA